MKKMVCAVLLLAFSLVLPLSGCAGKTGETNCGTCGGGEPPDPNKRMLDPGLVSGDGYAWVNLNDMGRSTAYIFNADSTVLERSAFMGTWVDESRGNWYTVGGALYAQSTMSTAGGFHLEGVPYRVDGESLTLTYIESDATAEVTYWKRAWPIGGGGDQERDPELVGTHWILEDETMTSTWRFEAGVGGVSHYRVDKTDDVTHIQVYVWRTDGDNLYLTDKMTGIETSHTYKIVGNELILDGATYMRREAPR